MSLYLKFLYDETDMAMCRNFTKGSLYAAGYDLCSDSDCVVEPFEIGVIPTGICLKAPSGCYGRIAPRSGLASRKMIGVGGGVIDCDYTGEIKVILFNHNNERFLISRGDRIAQFIVERCAHPIVKIVDELDETDRGILGFGSSGQ